MNSNIVTDPNCLSFEQFSINSKPLTSACPLAEPYQKFTIPQRLTEIVTKGVNCLTPGGFSGSIGRSVTYDNQAFDYTIKKGEQCVRRYRDSIRKGDSIFDSLKVFNNDVFQFDRRNDRAQNPRGLFIDCNKKDNDFVCEGMYRELNRSYTSSQTENITTEKYCSEGNCITQVSNNNETPLLNKFLNREELNAPELIKNSSNEQSEIKQTLEGNGPSSYSLLSSSILAGGVVVTGLCAYATIKTAQQFFSDLQNPKKSRSDRIKQAASTVLCGIATIAVPVVTYSLL